MSKPSSAIVTVAAIALVVGAGGGYAINEFSQRGQRVELEREIARLHEEARQGQAVEIPTDEEASAAIARSGRSIRISQCKPRVAVPGVTCTGTITTTRGSFAGTTQPGVLSFAKIDGTWTQVQ